MVVEKVVRWVVMSVMHYCPASRMLKCVVEAAGGGSWSFLDRLSSP